MLQGLFLVRYGLIVLFCDIIFLVGCFIVGKIPVELNLLYFPFFEYILSVQAPIDAQFELWHHGRNFVESMPWRPSVTISQVSYLQVVVPVATFGQDSILAQSDQSFSKSHTLLGRESNWHRSPNHGAR